MIRIASKRFVSLLATVFFLLTSAGEGFGFQPCPFHDALNDPDRGTEQASDDHHATGVDPDSHHPSSHDHGDSLSGSGQVDDDRVSAPPSGHDAHGHHGESGLCTHVDVCQSATGAHLGVDPGTLAVESFAEGSHTIDPPVERLFIAFLPFFLPYSNAPPALG